MDGIVGGWAWACRVDEAEINLSPTDYVPWPIVARVAIHRDLVRVAAHEVPLAVQRPTVDGRP
jgi:hypothetical protein